MYAYIYIIKYTNNIDSNCCRNKTHQYWYKYIYRKNTIIINQPRSVCSTLTELIIQ